MKIKYYLMSLVLATSCGFVFTSCDDDDDPVTVVEAPDLSFDADAMRVKIGEENKQALPIATGGGDYKAFSLDEEVAKVVEENGTFYVEGLKNGMTKVVVSDAAGSYKMLPVSVYTTEVMQLNCETYDLVTPLGLSSTSNDVYVVEGNGGYSVTSDNDLIGATIDEETGVLSLTAVSKKEEYSATVTVTDGTGLSASVAVTVKYTLDAYTESDFAYLATKTSNEAQYNGTYPYYLVYATWKESVNNGVVTFGGAYYTYAAIQISYPEGTAVGENVAGTLTYNEWGSTRVYDGTVRIVCDDATKRVAAWWKVDMDAERIDRGFVVWMK